MRLQKVAEMSGVIVNVICIKCSRIVSYERAWADLDGKPFESYYCDHCVGKADHEMEKGGD